MTRIALTAGFLLSLAAFAAPAGAADPSVSVERAWARATPGGAKTGSVYLTLTGHGGPDTVTGLSTPVAGMAMLHETINDNGVMKMRMIDALTLTPGAPVTLKPGGTHIMLEPLEHPLKAGETFPLTLTFAHAPPVTVTVTVAKLGAMAAP